MKKIWNLIAIACFALGATACDKEIQEPASDELTVTVRNLEGVWQLEQIDDTQLADDSYLYLELLREEQKYNLYDNLNSSFAHQKIGSYAIGADEEQRPILSGDYDHLFGASWNEEYIIESLTKEEMVWVGITSNESQHFVRVSEIPSDVLNGVRVAQ